MTVAAASGMVAADYGSNNRVTVAVPVHFGANGPVVAKALLAPGIIGAHGNGQVVKVVLTPAGVQAARKLDLDGKTLFVYAVSLDHNRVVYQSAPILVATLLVKDGRLIVQGNTAIIVQPNVAVLVLTGRLQLIVSPVLLPT